MTKTDNIKAIQTLMYNNNLNPNIVVHLKANANMGGSIPIEHNGDSIVLNLGIAALGKYFEDGTLMSFDVAVNGSSRRCVVYYDAIVGIFDPVLHLSVTYSIVVPSIVVPSIVEEQPKASKKSFLKVVK